MKTKRQEQFRTGFRSVQRLHSWVTAKALMLLVMLMVSVQGAWAQDSPFSSQCYGTEGASYNEGPASLLDYNEYTKWCVVHDWGEGMANPSVIFRVKTSVKLTHYKFNTANDTGTYPERNPSRWTLEAKYSRADKWVVISSVNNASLPSESLTESESFSVKAEYQDKSFRYFRLTFGQTYDFQLADIIFVGEYAEVDADDDDLSLPDPTIYGDASDPEEPGDGINYSTHFAYEEATIEPSSEEGNPIGNLFDEDPETSWTRESSTKPVDIYFHTRTAVKPLRYHWTLDENEDGFICNWALCAKVSKDDEQWIEIDRRDIERFEGSASQSDSYYVKYKYRKTQFRYFKLSIYSAFDLSLPEFVIEGEYSDPAADSDDYNHNGVIYAVRPSKGYATVVGYTGETTDVVIPSTLDYFGVSCSVDSIRHHAFQENRTITSISIPKSLKCIGASAFDNCSALKDVIFTGTDNQLNTIEEFAFHFAGVTNFDFTALPNLVSIGDDAFERTNVQTVDLSQCTKLANLGEFIFAECKVQGNVDLSAFVTLPKGMFAGCSNLTSFTLHPDVECIPDYIFEYTGVTAVDLSTYPKIGSIGIFAFSQCRSLSSIVLPNNVEVLQRQSLSKCEDLTSVTLPANLKTIEGAAFAGCSSLANLTFPASLELIRAQAFQGTAFTELDFSTAPDVTLLNGVFGGCEQLTRVVMPTNNTEVGNELFKGCTNLTEVVLPANATRIGQRAFEDCTGFTAISLPSSVSQIDEGAFHNCSNLQTFTMPASLVTIGNYAFEGCTKLPNFTLPATLTSIAGSAFKGCSSITSVTIPDEVSVIKANTFSGCSKLTSLNLGTSKMKLRTLENDAFAGCPLTDIMVYSALDNWDNQTTTAPFPASVYENATVTFGACPKGNVRNLKVWKDFKNLVGRVNKNNVYVCEGLTDCEVHFYTFPDYSYNIKDDFGIHNINGAVLVSGSATGDIVLPDEVEGFPIVGIAKNIFYENSNVTSISFPGTLRMIENNAVEKMSNLKKVEFRDQLFPRGEKCYIGYAVYDYVDEEAFYECDALEEVVIGCDLDWCEDEDEPFEDRDNLKTIRITKGCPAIGKDDGSNHNLFNECDGLKELIIEDSEESLYFRKYAFMDDWAIEHFYTNFIELDYLYLGRNIDDKCIKDEDYSPFYNTKINRLVVGDCVRYINAWLFHEAHVYIEQLGRNIKEIGKRAFNGGSATFSPDCYCPNLEVIGVAAFSNIGVGSDWHSFWFDPNNPSESKLKRIEPYGIQWGAHVGEKKIFDKVYLPATLEYLGKMSLYLHDNQIRNIYFYPNLHEKTVEIDPYVFSDDMDIYKSNGRDIFTIHTVCANSDMGKCGFPNLTLEGKKVDIPFVYDLHVIDSKEASTLHSDGLYHEVCKACGTDDGRSAKTGNYYIHNWNGTNDLKIHKDGSSYSYAGPLAIDDSKPFQSPVSFSAESVSYNRTVTGGRVATFILPFAADASDVNGTVYKFREFKDSKFCFDEQTGALDANTPYLVVVDENATQLLSGVSASSLAATVNSSLSPLDSKVIGGTAEHVGSFAQQTFADGQNGKSYYGYDSKDGMFVKAQSATLKPFRTMFTLPQAKAPTRARLQLGDDDVNGIIEVDTDLLDGEGSPMYDLNGVRITNPVHGKIYIQNGKKVVGK